MVFFKHARFSHVKTFQSVFFFFTGVLCDQVLNITPKEVPWSSYSSLHLCHVLCTTLDFFTSIRC